MKKLIILLVTILMQPICMMAYKDDFVDRYNFDGGITDAIRDYALNVRKNDLCAQGTISFDGIFDEDGDEIFRVDLTLNVFYKFSIFDDIMGFVVIDNAPIYIKDTLFAKSHLTKAVCENNFNSYYRLECLSGIGAFEPYEVETFYFVIKGDKVLRYDK